MTPQIVKKIFFVSSTCILFLLVARDEQRRPTAVSSLVNRRASLEKQLGALELALLARNVQRREATARGLQPRARGLQISPILTCTARVGLQADQRRRNRADCRSPLQPPRHRLMYCNRRHRRRHRPMPGE